jgi:hypothetical protein
MLIFVVRFGCKLKFAFFALGAQARNPLFWQSQCGPQAPYGVYFCFLSCPGTLPTLLRVLVGFDCVYVVHITRTKLKFAFFAVGAQVLQNPLFWQSQCGPQAPYGEYFCFLSFFVSFFLIIINATPII